MVDARRATGLVLACLVLATLSQGPGGRDGGRQVGARQLAQLRTPSETGSGHLAAVAPSHNISGTYRGSWARRQSDPGLGSLLSQDVGAAVFRLGALPSLREGVHNVQGEVVLRDGEYASEADVLLRLQGVYVADVGRLMAVLEPLSPVSVPLGPRDAVMHLDEYRHALRQAASNWLAASGGSSYKQVSAAAAAVSSGGKFTRECAFSAELTFRRNGTQQGGSGGGVGLVGRQLGPPGMQLAGGGGQDLVVGGTISSSNCGVVLSLNASTTHVEAYYAKAVNYTAMVTILSFVQIMLLVRQMEASSTQALASKVSLLTIGQQAVLDGYLCLLHLTVGIMVEPLFNAFATAAFFQFVVFAIFEMRFLLSVWRARLSGSLDPWTAQRELSILYGRLYGALLGGILLSYYLQRWLKAAVFLLYTFWLPQIVYCVRTDSRQPLRPLYVVGMSAARLALPLYLYGCPSNLLRVAPSPGVCIGLTLFVASQASILLLQYAYGPRCIIPKRFLPPRYDYHRPLPVSRHDCSVCDIETGDSGRECVICMSPVDVAAASQRMLTPCDHCFHSTCLERWLAVSMTCPTCRKPLPPP